jgi:hypothetical protein
LTFVDNQVFLYFVAGKRFYAHRICLLASSDAFRAMFDGGYRVGTSPLSPLLAILLLIIYQKETSFIDCSLLCLLATILVLMLSDPG